MSAQTDNPSLSPNGRSRRPRPHRDDAEIVAAIGRQIRALGHRLADDDPPTADLLLRLQRELEDAFAEAVSGWRRSGFSDGAIGEVLGVTKQAVAQRWPRSAGR